MPDAIRLHTLSAYQTLAFNERKGSFVAQIKPPAMQQQRPPVKLVLALDVSGSMEGDKLTSALTSAQAIIRALSAEDTFACVVFNGKALTLIAPTAMTGAGKQYASEKMRRVTASGNTNLADAMLVSLELARSPTGRGRVLLLTDGCPTEGVTSPDMLVNMAERASSTATLSTFGFGRDVNPLLLSSLSEAGRGNYTFIEVNEPPVAAIAGELGGMLMTVAANARLLIEPAPGVTIDQIHRTGCTRQGASVELELSTLVAEEDVSLPLDLSWTEIALGKPLARLTLRAYDTGSGNIINLESTINPPFASHRGPPDGDAMREILMGRASVALRQASQDQRRGRDLALELAALRGELLGQAKLAGVDGDPQVSAALDLLLDAQKGLEGRGEQAARQDMVASSRAIGAKRSTFTGLGGAKQAAFMSKSQMMGMDIVNRNDPDKKP